jgi:hypothetical protein
MSDASGTAERDRWAFLPERLRPRDVELPGLGSMRLVETTLLLLLGLLLAVATVNDVVRQTHVNDRLIADIATWRAYSGHAYHNLSIEQELFGAGSQKEVVCGNTSPGGPKARTQLCLVIYGPASGSLRTVHGGWYLPPKVDDVRADRYSCFGAGAKGLCPR